MYVAWYQRLLSYFYPVRIARRMSELNPVLDIYLSNNQFQLATDDALYSDGSRYRPLLLAFNTLKKELPAVKKVLVLGTGLGSAVQILHARGLHPEYTLVELDYTVLQLAMELMPAAVRAAIHPVCEDAQKFMRSSNDVYDLLVVDVFVGREVPGFVVQPEFLQQCRRSLTPGKGKFVLNYILLDAAKYQSDELAIRSVFPAYELLELGINKIFVATA